MSFSQLIRGLFFEYDKSVATIYHLRLPRIFISILAGAAISTSGVLFQSVMKNPLADPGIIGVTSGAAFFSTVVALFWPGLRFILPVAALLGAFVAFCLVYLLAWKEGLTPVRIILVGIAIESVFRGLTSVINGMGGGQMIESISGAVSLKTWSDVKSLAIFVIIGLFFALSLVQSCNYMAMDDKTVRGIGINIDLRRILCSLAGVFLAGIAAGFVGSISFLGLIAPHIARILVGRDHKYLMPFSMLLGSFILLAADTIGRLIAYPNEIHATIVMSIIGGPFFIFLLKRRNRQNDY